MSVDAAGRPDPRWTFSAPKLYGWLTGLFLAAFGGMMCAVPVGTILGVPVVVAGVLMCLSFVVAMSATSVPQPITLPLNTLGLALLVVGRWLAPVDQIIESFRVGEELISNPGPAGAFGIPLMLIGTMMVATFMPWIRAPERLNFVRSLVAMVLIETAAVLLLIGAVLTTPGTPLENQPLWIWAAVPLGVGIGIGLRKRWQGGRWVLAAVLTGVTLPLIWYLLA